MDTVKINGDSFPVVMAITEEEQARGLMFQEWPPPVMAFPSKLGVRKFWMKNTYCPLDIVFCRDGKIIQICRGEPLSTMAVGPNQPSDLVVEFPAGTMDKHGIRVGDKIELGLEKTAAIIKRAGEIGEIEEWIEDNVKWPANKCFFYSAVISAIFPDAKLYKGTHTGQWDEDTAHFYVEVDGKVIDPTGGQYDKGEIELGDRVSVFANIDEVINDPLFKTLSEKDQEKIKDYKRRRTGIKAL